MHSLIDGRTLHLSYSTDDVEHRYVAFEPSFPGIHIPP